MTPADIAALLERLDELAHDRVGSDNEAAEFLYRAADAIRALQEHTEMYVAEMSDAKAAGFANASDLFTSYTALQADAVPREATVEMYRAGLDAYSGSDSLYDMWRAMYDAAKE